MVGITRSKVTLFFFLLFSSMVYLESLPQTFSGVAYMRGDPHYFYSPTHRKGRTSRIDTIRHSDAQQITPLSPASTAAQPQSQLIPSYWSSCFATPVAALSRPCPSQVCLNEASTGRVGPSLSTVTDHM